MTRAEMLTMIAADAAADWTRVPDGRSNTSETYLNLVHVVETMIRHNTSLQRNPSITARMIVSQLAHKHGLRPTEKPGHE